MADFVTLTCPSCGGKLQVTKEIDRFACGHCGNEHLVRREGGIVYLQPLVEGTTGIRTGVDRAAAELAVPRLKKEVAELENDMKIATHTTVDREFPKSFGETLALFLGNLGRLYAPCEALVVATGNLHVEQSTKPFLKG